MADKKNVQEAIRASQKKTLLVALEEWGTVRKACQVAGVSRPVFYLWNSNDPEFSVSADAARKSFAESLEELALDRVRNPDKGKGSDILLLGLLNANMPHKFRPQLSMNEDSAKELIVEWRKAAKEVKKDRPAEEGTILGEDVEKTLQEILAKKGADSKKTEASDSD